MIELPKLPWAHAALEPHISKDTIHFHYDKHHKAYVDNLNKLIVGTDFENMDLDKIIKESKSGPVFNNAAQVWNHTFYWHSMSPDPTWDKDSVIGKAIVASFSSKESFEREFIERGKKLFGSGWVWLVKTGKDLKIEVTKNAGQPEDTPLFVCDVWEHAYYLDTQNERPKYIENFLKLANWKFAEKNLK